MGRKEGKKEKRKGGRKGWALTVCGVLVDRVAWVEDKLLWWLERELQDKNGTTCPNKRTYPQ